MQEDPSPKRLYDQMTQYAREHVDGFSIYAYYHDSSVPFTQIMDVATLLVKQGMLVRHGHDGRGMFVPTDKLIPGKNPRPTNENLARALFNLEMRHEALSYADNDATRAEVIIQAMWDSTKPREGRPAIRAMCEEHAKQILNEMKR